jgi:hypothetical protein
VAPPPTQQPASSRLEPANQRRPYLSSGCYTTHVLAPHLSCSASTEGICNLSARTRRLHSRNMSYRTLSRPIGLAFTSARTPALVRPFSTVLDTPVDPSTQRATPPTLRASVFEDALHAVAPRTNWTKEEIAQVYNTPLIELTHASVCPPCPPCPPAQSAVLMTVQRPWCTGASMTPPQSRCAPS